MIAEIPLDEAEVTAVCVAYLPDMDRLCAAVNAVATQVQQVLLVDNSEDPIAQQTLSELARSKSLVYLGLGTNKGLADALNVGIEWAIESGSTHVLLLDQDSIPASDMVARLLAGQRQAECSNGSPIAAIGPCYQDVRFGAARHVRFHRFPPKRVSVADEPDVFPVDMLVSSGTLIPAQAFEGVGLMDGNLFVDHIDTDWCLRAARAGWRLLAVKAASMQHRLGDHRGHLLGRELPVHRPMRLFYVFRNSLWLYRRNYATWQWIASDLRRLAVVFVLHAVHGKPRLASLRRMVAGVAAGMRRQSGVGPQVVERAR